MTPRPVADSGLRVGLEFGLAGDQVRVRQAGLGALPENADQGLRRSRRDDLVRHDRRKAAQHRGATRPRHVGRSGLRDRVQHQVEGQPVGQA